MLTEELLRLLIVDLRPTLLAALRGDRAAELVGHVIVDHDGVGACLPDEVGGALPGRLTRVGVEEVVGLLIRVPHLSPRLRSRGCFNVAITLGRRRRAV